MQLEKNIGKKLWKVQDQRILFLNTQEYRPRTMHALSQAPPALSIQQHLQLLFAETHELLIAFLRFLFLPSPRIQAKYPRLLRNLFLIYLFPAFIILGSHAIFLMAFYQIGFNMLLRAALYK